jgi:ribonuclease P protein subunit POP4
MSITPNNLVRHELIGLRAKVVSAKNPKNEGIEGRVVDETYKTLVIEHKGIEKTVFKGSVMIIFTLPDKQKVEVEGELLVARPWDRIKKKMPKY